VPRTLDFREGLEVITKLTLELADQIPTPILLVDGRAGSGKSTFAQLLRDEIFKAGEPAPTIVSMDDLYPGWEGLREGSRYLEERILGPLVSGKKAVWQVWDWGRNTRGNAGEPGNGWREFTGGNILIVEGCGSISRVTASQAQVRIWVDADISTRKSRFHDRDAGAFDQNWSIWAAQEDEFFAEEGSESLVDFRLRN
jgi:uridine kinase